jgi:hypothetical protein
LAVLSNNTAASSAVDSKTKTAVSHACLNFIFICR